MLGSFHWEKTPAVIQFFNEQKVDTRMGPVDLERLRLALLSRAESMKMNYLQSIDKAEKILLADIKTDDEKQLKFPKG